MNYYPLLGLGHETMHVLYVFLYSFGELNVQKLMLSDFTFF